MPDEEVSKNQAAIQQQVSVTTKSHPMNAELHSGTEPHSDAELQNEVNTHYDSEVLEIR